MVSSEPKLGLSTRSSLDKCSFASIVFSHATYFINVAISRLRVYRAISTINHLALDTNRDYSLF